MKTKLPAISDKHFTSKMLEAILTLSEGLTGIAVSNKEDFILSGSRLFQSAINRNFYHTLKSEWDSYKQKGRIKDDYEGTEQHHACLQEMLDFLDSDLPDRTRFEFMKKIFLVASTEKTLDRDSILPQQYMRICRSLKSGEILVLVGVYKMVKQGSWNPKNSSAVNWLKDVACISGLEHNDLVSVYEKKLIENVLITPRTLADSSGIETGKYNRLTPLGYELCRFVEAYDTLKET
jgi:hypothetical protein